MGRQALSVKELGRLRRENHRLRQERDILAKAAALPYSTRRDGPVAKRFDAVPSSRIRLAPSCPSLHQRPALLEGIRTAGKRAQLACRPDVPWPIGIDAAAAMSSNVTLSFSQSCQISPWRHLVLRAVLSVLVFRGEPRKRQDRGKQRCEDGPKNRLQASRKNCRSRSLDRLPLLPSTRDCIAAC